ncbi:UDP-glucose 4-epimerase GalE [Helicobacter enhydrae]|uniref:UDP-glucose 4-epimerase n=1 Tax=Helicobacter enhydrae TaxID=222136 RepID=A0A1B1U3J8_9HELI|nr:UDP-glucose 4-epimerase GalE [Helicobacter enhydrae]ANV97331.1 UDP-glucose 4-epimerase GalE [Helicobacter enhydrae]
MKLLLTGGSGYIGSHTAYEFLKNTDAQITLLDNLSTGFIQNYKYLSAKFGDRVQMVQMDLNELAKLDHFLQNNHFDAIVHFAASIVVSESMSNPAKYYLNNTANTTHLINLCLKHKIKNFIFSSTAAVYGEPSCNPVTESTPTSPINPYGYSKLMSEQVLLDVSKANDFCYVALRYFNVAGANYDNTPQELQNGGGLGQRSLNATHLIKVASECATGKRHQMSIYGDTYTTPDGSCIRDYIHINDLARAHISALDYLYTHQKSNIFNVGYNQGYSVKEVIEVMKKVSCIDFEVRIDAPRDGDPAMLIASNQKILECTTWKPQYNDLTLICKSAYEWEISLNKNQAM